MKEYRFQTAREWLDACAAHRCLLYSYDSPAKRELGYMCPACEESFMIGLAAVKADTSMESWERDMVRTAEGRVELPMVWAGSCIFIVEEWDD